MNRFKDSVIVVPWDFQEMSLEQLKLAAEIAESNEQIEVIHVRTYAHGVKPNPDKYQEKFLEELPPEYEGVNFTVSYDIDLKHGLEIAKFAKEKDAGLIVISSHGRRGISKLLLGSVAETVVCNSPCPVIVLRD